MLIVNTIGGAIGHSTYNCGAFKGKVQSLIRNGWLEMESESAIPNVEINPLPNHETGKRGNVHIIECIGDALEPEMLIVQIKGNQELDTWGAKDILILFSE